VLDPQAQGIAALWKPVDGCLDSRGKVTPLKKFSIVNGFTIADWFGIDGVPEIYAVDEHQAITWRKGAQRKFATSLLTHRSK
jgi:hypothetical protein